MSKNHRKWTNNREQELRIAELKLRAAQAAGGEMMAWESNALPGDEREKFWRSVVGCETGQSTTDFQRLTESGVELPQPAAIGDEQLTVKLWEVIRALARMRVFISQTDHLSDRELYSVLWHRVLREDVPMIDCGETSYVGLLSTGSEADTCLYLKHYAHEDWRRRWLAEFPDYEMPAHEDPPYCRDRNLPKPDYQP